MLLRSFSAKDDRKDGRPLYEALVLKARHLADITACAGRWASATAPTCTAKIPQLSPDLPMIVEIVDSADRIQTLRVPRRRAPVRSTAPMRAKCSAIWRTSAYLQPAAAPVGASREARRKRG
jgi:PII-like signaling protein